MYLDPWMIVILCGAFGCCAFVNARIGFYQGAAATLEVLEKNKYIKVAEDGSVSRWSPYNDPVKKSRPGKRAK